MSEVISVSNCEIELTPGSKDYVGSPMANRNSLVSEQGRLSTFRVTSSDELNMMVELC
jgi:hypothetical protein